MIKEGDRIVHSILGEGEVIFVENGYFEVSFDNDVKNAKFREDKYDLRKFTEETIKPFLVKVIPSSEQE